MDTLYIIVSNNSNEPDSPYIITVQRRPGVTNMSREPRERGWLGCTGGLDRQAMGEFTPNEAREFLRTWGVQLPDDVPVLRNRYETNQYHSAGRKCGTGEREEAWNREVAYPWRGPWVDVPTEEMRWCREPRTIAETRVVPFSVYSDDEYQVVITGDEKSTYGWRIRSWHELDNSYPTMREEAERLAASLIGRVFDAGRCPIWTDR